MFYIWFLIIHWIEPQLSNQCVVSNYNFDNKINVNRTSYYKKEIKIPWTNL